MEETTPKHFISEDNWKDKAELRDSLKPTSTFQLEQLTPGDMLRAWIKCKADVSENHSMFSVDLLKFMEEREKLLLGNEVMR